MHIPRSPLAAQLACLVVVGLLAVVPAAWAMPPADGLSGARAHAAQEMLQEARERGVGALPASPFLRPTACGRSVRVVRLRAARHRRAVGAARRTATATRVQQALRQVRQSRRLLQRSKRRRDRMCVPRVERSTRVNDLGALAGTVTSERPTGVVAGTGKVLALPVDFGDAPARRAEHAPERYESLLFGRDYPHGGGSMARYFREMSYGMFDVAGEVRPWRRMPRARAAYAGDAAGMGAYPRNSQSLLEDAVAVNDREVDFAQFDNDGPDGRPNSGDDDGFVDAVMLIYAGTSAAEGAGGGALWPHAWRHAVATRDAAAGGGFIRVSRYAAVPERMQEPGPDGDLLTVGIAAHEYAHVLGLPDLVDGAERGHGPGDWDLMGSGLWGFEHSSRPTGMSAWSRIRLGWLTPRLLEGDHPGHVMQPSYSRRTVVKLPVHGKPLHEHFLVERRTREGFDADLPAEGLLLWHVDDSRGVGGTEPYPRVALVAADGTAGGDAGDLIAPGTNLNDATDPSTRAHDGAASLVAIQNLRTTPSYAVDLHAGAASLAPAIDRSTEQAGPQAAAPTATLSAPAAGARLRGAVTMTCDATGSPNINRIQFLADGKNLTGITVSPSAASVSTSYSWSSTSVADGGHTLGCRARNTPNQWSAISSVSVTVDNTVPGTPSIPAPVDDAWLRGTSPITATGTDNFGVTAFSYQVGGVDNWQGPWAEASPQKQDYAWDTTTVADGTYTLTVVSRDLAGNVSGTSLARTVKVDNTPPAMPTPTDGAALPDVSYQTATSTLDAIWDPATDSGSGVASYTWRFCTSAACTTVVASGSGNPTSASASGLTLADGTYHACVRATDVAGNVSAEQCSDGVIVDSTGPVMPVPNDGAAAPDIDSQSSTTTLDANWAAADDGAGSGVASYDWRLCSSTACTTVLASGAGATQSAAASGLTLTPGTTYFACVRATDQLGNTGVEQCSDGVTVSSGPAVTISAPLAGATIGGSASIDATATDADGVTKVEYRIDGTLRSTEGPFAATTPKASSWTWNTLSPVAADGSHVIEVTAYDAAGMVGSASITVIVDNAAPATSHGGISAGSRVTGTVTLTSSSTDGEGITSVDYLVDSIARATTTTAATTSFSDSVSWDTTTVLDGNHAIRVAATDVAGNVGYSSPVTLFIVHNNADVTAPGGAIDGALDGATLTGSVNLVASATDDNAVTKVEFLLDGAVIASDPFVPAGWTSGNRTKSWSSTARANGSYTLSARITDAGGNASTTAGVPVTISN